MALVLVALVVLMVSAQAEDYWTTCERAYEFCMGRPYHRDCKIWTAWNKPLLNSVPNAKWSEIRDPNTCLPTEQYCVVRGGEYPYNTVECPIPEKYKAPF